MDEGMKLSARNRKKLVTIVHGAVKCYLNAHGHELPPEVVRGLTSLEKRVVGAVWGALKDGQFEHDPVPCTHFYLTVQGEWRCELPEGHALPHRAGDLSW